MIFKKDIIQINDFLSKPFPLLNDTKSKLFLIVFCGLFSTVFILHYNPFNLQHIKYDTALAHYLPIWITSILGAIILSITQFFLRPKLGFNILTLKQFILWICLEMVLLCFGVFLFFGENKEPFVDEFLLIFKYTISICFLPYFFSCLILVIVKLYSKIEHKKQIELESKLPSQAQISTQQIFTKDNGTVLFGIKPEQILYLKSDNNYTAIFYHQNKK